MADDIGAWKKGSYTELNRQLAGRERASKRSNKSSLAKSGSLYSGATQESERQIEGATNDAFLQGSQTIEDRAEAARQAELARQQSLTMQANQFGENAAQRGWQTGEREGTQLFQTGEREGTQQWQSGESEAERQARLEIQKMSDAARYELQELVNSGQMTLQEAEQKWTTYENDLNRQLEWKTTEGGWTQEQELQMKQLAFDTWSQEFGADTAMLMQDDTQAFEELMAQMGRDWELDDRPWQDANAMADRQLAMLAAGYDWLNDEYNTGMPSWMVANAGEGATLEGGLQYTTHPGGAAAGWVLGRTSPYLDADGNPTSDPSQAVGNNPDYDPNAPQDDAAYDENGGFYDQWGHYHPPSIQGGPRPGHAGGGNQSGGWF